MEKTMAEIIFKKFIVVELKEIAHWEVDVPICSRKVIDGVNTFFLLLKNNRNICLIL